MNSNFYDILWVSKTATQDEIKKAYKKKAMEYHPDRNKWSKIAEDKFKEVQTAYDTLWDISKRKNYDTYGSNSFNWNPFWQYQSGYSSSQYSDLDDLFSSFWWNKSGFKSGWFDFWDIFSNFEANQKSKNNNYQEKEEISVDIEKTYEIPIFDLILWCKIEVEWFLWQKAKLKIPENTKPWTKFRVKDFGKNIWGKKWNLIVNIDVKMPRQISDLDKSLLQNVRDNIIY